ncbi:kinase-like protein [Athelia psychrophila]|uniref:Kinase-like protein n=1 Tax=Athelia psychrophila TaxID=1759441 RepID=A0A167UXT5_9AGAM|nr:kinase-like protein [Fibularhizoctonia sp. CBS 109695]
MLSEAVRILKLSSVSRASSEAARRHLAEIKVPSSDASPGPLDLTGRVSREGEFPSGLGGFADVWKGIWTDARGSHAVAIKVLRAPLDDPAKQSKMQKRLRRELCVWQRLKHKNILVLHGTASNFGNCLGFVCPWLENGSINKYLKKQGANLLMTHRLQLLCEVAAGLAYLHALGVVHGDLTGANILIADDDGSACLCDFGLSSIAAEFQGTSYITSTMGGNIRWLAPELLEVDEDGIVNVVNIHSDAYSYGSVTLEILSGQLPFPNLPVVAQVMMAIYKGQKSCRPVTPYVTDQLWGFINQCWADTPTARPTAEELLKSMHRFRHQSLP